MELRDSAAEALFWAEAIQEAIFAEESAAFDVSNGPLLIGLSMVGPTLMSHGTRAQQTEHLPRLLRHGLDPAEHDRRTHPRVAPRARCGPRRTLPGADHPATEGE
jgi:hypothetical protein